MGKSVVIYGAGAVGGYLGGNLALANPDLTVRLIARPPTVKAINDSGLILRRGDAEQTARVQAAESALGIPPCDLVILGVRAYDVERSVEDVRRLIGDRGLVLAMQNGVGSEEVLSTRLGPERVLAGTLTARVGTEAPGTVVRHSRSGGVALASLGGGSIPLWILEAFQSTRLPTVSIDDYRSLRWSKLLLNMLGAPISAILDVDMPDLVRNDDLFRLERRAFLEAVRVMNAQRIRAVNLPGYPVPLARLAMRLPLPAARRTIGRRLTGARGGQSPAMRTEMDRGKTEIAYLNGAVAAAAQELGLQAPVNAALTELVETLSSDQRQRERFRGQPGTLSEWLAQRGTNV